MVALFIARAEAGGGDGVGGGGHVFSAAGQNDIGVAGADSPGSLYNGFHTGAAHHADRVRGHFNRDSRADGDLTRHVLSETGC